MKIQTDTITFESDMLGANAFSLPQGIVGFPEYTRAELLHQADQFPFLWMRLQGSPGTINFIVIEPSGIIPGYEPELFDNDAAALDLADSSEAMVLSILTMKQGAPAEATVNLIGPIIVNRRTRIGRQLVIANYSQYVARYPLVALPPAEAASA
jgi:flagellar assembly factor FliW